MRAKIVLAITLVSVAAAGLPAAAMAAFSRLGAEQVAWCCAGMLIVESVLLAGVFERRAPVFGPVFWRGRKDRRAVAITFDDGPNEPYTSQVLDILRLLGVPATFFVLGKNAARAPAAVKRAVREGHEIGNHGYDHGVLPMKGPSHIRDQIVTTSDLVEEVTGARPALFRPSHGWRNPWVNRTARKAGCLPVAWTLGVWDTDRPGAEKIVRRTLKGLRNGSIVLLHDGRGAETDADASQLVEALPTIIRTARDRGYRFVTVSDMVREASER
jgi:peptidoglycan/xylan/chitin deacetylase (PgdA/CDA1 family)